MSETVISVRGITKSYRIGKRKQSSATLAGRLMEMLKAPIENYRHLRSLSDVGNDEATLYRALNDVSFDVGQGEVLGIIGHNGAGKSTLLKILSRITPPTSGEIEIIGRVSSLLEVGTGFHPELTGRDNIYMNGTIHGMRKREIDRKLEEIIEFSGVSQFIDTPVKFYSTGMKVRLGFAVAAHLEPEILVIDEVLAVGDAGFQRKCLDKMDDFSKGGRTVLFVSHDMSAIRNICPQTIVLKNGCLFGKGESSSMIEKYLLEVPGQDGPYRIDDPVIRVTSFDIKIEETVSFVAIKYEILNDVRDLFIGFTITDMQGVTVLKTYDLQESENTLREKGAYESVFEFQTKTFSPGRYSLRFNVLIHRIRWISRDHPVFTMEIPYFPRVNDVNIDAILNKVGEWSVLK